MHDARSAEESTINGTRDWQSHLFPGRSFKGQTNGLLISVQSLQKLVTSRTAQSELCRATFSSNWIWLKHNGRKDDIHVIHSFTYSLPGTAQSAYRGKGFLWLGAATKKML